MKIDDSKISKRPYSAKVNRNGKNVIESNFYLKVKTRQFMSNFKKMPSAELRESRCKAYNYAL